MKTRYRCLLLGLLICVQSSCLRKENSQVPKSVKVTDEIVEFRLRNNNYEKVEFGSDANGSWLMAPMENHDSVWVMTILNPHKTLEYRFFINGKDWINDPLNPRKKKIPPPYEGYHSVIVLE